MAGLPAARKGSLIGSSLSKWCKVDISVSRDAEKEPHSVGESTLEKGHKKDSHAYTHTHIKHKSDSIETVGFNFRDCSTWVMAQHERTIFVIKCPFSVGLHRPVSPIFVPYFTATVCIAIHGMWVCNYFQQNVVRSSQKTLVDLSKRDKSGNQSISTQLKWLKSPLNHSYLDSPAPKKCRLPWKRYNSNELEDARLCKVCVGSDGIVTTLVAVHTLKNSLPNSILTAKAGVSTLEWERFMRRALTAPFNEKPYPRHRQILSSQQTFPSQGLQ